MSSFPYKLFPYKLFPYKLFSLRSCYLNWHDSKQALKRSLAAALHFSGATAVLARKSSLPWRILTYHRIVDADRLPFPIQPGMYVRPRTFEMHMRYLAAHCRVVPLGELLQALKSSTPVQDSTTVITFDDGWRDNFDSALPVLRELNLPATIFLPTAYIGSNDYFWTDRVPQTITSLRGAPEYHTRVLALFQEKFPSLPQLTADIRRLVSSEEFSVDTLEHFINALKDLPPRERKAVVDELHLLAKEFTTLIGERLFMDWNEVHEMSLHRIDFGSHSHSHTPMTELTDVQLRDELVNSYQELRSHALEPSGAFCYPGGYSNGQTQAALAEIGVEYALSVETASRFDTRPNLLGRVHLHEDISDTVPMFTARVWGPGLFRG
jgi:peptidoglycan/xylan/chitin deacetylase (PgdA/CDA1 family)